LSCSRDAFFLWGLAAGGHIRLLSLVA
jgi:hypothetical protein